MRKRDGEDDDGQEVRGKGTRERRRRGGGWEGRTKRKVKKKKKTRAIGRVNGIELEGTCFSYSFLLLACVPFARGMDEMGLGREREWTYTSIRTWTVTVLRSTLVFSSLVRSNAMLETPMIQMTFALTHSTVDDHAWKGERERERQRDKYVY